MPEIEVIFPESTPKQEEIEKSPAKIKVIAAGRRFGKTTLFAKKACQDFIKGKKTIEAAPVAKQTTAFWRKCKGYLRPLIDAGYVYKNESDRILQMGNGFIQCQTAYDANTLRGDWAHTLLLDEYSYMDRSAWEVIGAPMLIDTNGEAWFAFTPNRRNHAYTLAMQALVNEPGDMAFFSGSTYDNTYLSPEAIRRLTSVMTEEMIKQEIMAEFLESEGQVFHNLESSLIAPTTTPDHHRGHFMVAGVDWGKLNDFTAISIVCAKCKQEVELRRFNQIDYHFQRQKLVELVAKWGVEFTIIELNSIGIPMLEELQRTGIRVTGFTTTNTSKAGLIESLALGIEQGSIQFLPDKVGTLELEAYERKMLISGVSRYSAPEGLHDDTVIARGLSYRGCLMNPQIEESKTTSEISTYLKSLEKRGIL